MNLRQMQRTLAEVLAKCEGIHVQLPVDPFDSILSAGEALRHSRVDGKFHPNDAVDELKQRYGLEPKWQQLEDAAEAKRRNRQKRRRLRRGDETADHDEAKSARGTHAGTRASDTDSADDAGSPAGSHVASHAATTKRRTTGHGSSRIDHIIENNPAKNPENEELAEEFVELGGYELERGETQKGISRMAVAKQIREATEPITSGAAARRLPHVGPSAAAKIDEVLHHGKMKVLEQLDAEKATKTEGSMKPTAKATQNASADQADNEDDQHNDG